LIGTDLVRLGLEQCQNARQAVNLLTHLIESCGQGSFPGCNPDRDYDSAFVVADPSEAYVIETAGRHWVYQEIQEVRALDGVRVVRQDWDRISRGLADLAIERGWWPEDGSKIDFAGVAGEMTQEEKAALKRWTGTSFRLQEQNGHIDLAFVRRVLTEQDELQSEQEDSDFSDWHSTASIDDTTAASMVAGLSLKPGHAPMAWCALGSPCPGLYFPVFLDGELPELLSRSKTLCAQTYASRTAADAIGSERGLWASARDSLLRLQARIELETEEFLLEYAAIKERGYAADLERQTSLFMEHNVEQVEEVLGESIRSPSGMPSV
jgi:secernin